MATANAVIVVKKKGGGHHDEHGNTAWKIAYADFVTAMMAFFLLLWLLSAVTEEQMEGISNYFAPTSVSYSKSGAGGVLGGTDVMKEGAMSDSQASIGMSSGAMSNSEESADDEVVSDEGGTKTAADADGAEGGDPLAAFAAADEARLEAMERQLQQALQASPDLQELAKHVVVDMTEEGLRIQIVDLEKRSLFKSGSAQLSTEAAKLLRLVANTIAAAPNDVKVSGHTDAAPYSSAGTYSNWELSSDRANASRRALVVAGVPEERIKEVTGRADTEPFDPVDPFAPVNRRISIVLKHMAPPPAATASDEPEAP
jgi:chemotaxis protein MotB